MRACGVSIGLVVLFVSAICLSGCSKKDDKPAETKAPVTRRAAAETSTLIEQFLDRRVRMRSIAAGDPIKSFFARWEDILHHRSRLPLDIHFAVDVDGTFGGNHAWENTTGRQILDSLCQACNLTWTIEEPNTIRITAKTP